MKMKTRGDFIVHNVFIASTLAMRMNDILISIFRQDILFDFNFLSPNEHENIFISFLNAQLKVFRGFKSRRYIRFIASVWRFTLLRTLRWFLVDEFWK